MGVIALITIPAKALAHEILAINRFVVLLSYWLGIVISATIIILMCLWQIKRWLLGRLI